MVTMNTRYSPHCQLTDLLDAADSLRETRHQLHRNPELSFRESATSGLVAARLEGWGWHVTRSVGGHGVVGTLKAGDGLRAVAIRADMDALPIVEETGKPWASAVSGVMHACGHDGHTTMRSAPRSGSRRHATASCTWCSNRPKKPARTAARSS
jgi:hippurate hydrolase